MLTFSMMVMVTVAAMVAVMVSSIRPLRRVGWLN